MAVPVGAQVTKRMRLESRAASGYGRDNTRGPVAKGSITGAQPMMALRQRMRQGWVEDDHCTPEYILNVRNLCANGLVLGCLERYSTISSSLPVSWCAYFATCR